MLVVTRSCCKHFQDLHFFTFMTITIIVLGWFLRDIDVAQNKHVPLKRDDSNTKHIYINMT